MLLEYIVLFEELMEISKKITINTVSPKMKQQLEDVTMNILKDIKHVLDYPSKKGHNISKGKELMIDLVFQSHKERLYNLIEQLGFHKNCSKCGREFPITPKYFHKDHRAKHGVRNDCVECHRKKQKDLYYQKKKYSDSCALTKEEEELISEEYENIIQE